MWCDPQSYAIRVNLQAALALFGNVHNASIISRSCARIRASQALSIGPEALVHFACQPASWLTLLCVIANHGSFSILLCPLHKMQSLYNNNTQVDG
jgi:hypothetical protein